MRLGRSRPAVGLPAPEATKVSVIMAAYQHEDFVAEAVASVLAQSHDNLELIVVDDCSADRTAQIVAGFADPRLQLVELPRNRIKHARNLGLSLATGELVAFQNSDDVWAESKLSKQVSLLHDAPANAAVFTRVRFIGADSEPSDGGWAQGAFKGVETNSIAWLRRFFDHGNDLCISSAMCRRGDLERIGGFNPALIQVSDLDLWVRLAALGELVIVEEQLTSMRIDAERNLSAPSQAVENRSVLELVAILDRYTRDPIRPLLPQIFPGIGEGGRLGPVLMAQLAIYGIRHHGQAQRFFGDQLFARILAQPGGYDRIVEVFGPEVILEYYEHRGRMVIQSE